MQNVWNQRQYKQLSKKKSLNLKVFTQHILVEFSTSYFSFCCEEYLAINVLSAQGLA